MVTYFKIEKNKKMKLLNTKLPISQIYIFGIYTLYNIRETT